ncbi:MAG: 3-hydroxyacyl-ACP dehydratase FabZ family protein [Verrucomicrobiales bacterium]
MASRDPLTHALAALPHGPAFRFVDSLTALDPGKSASGRYRVRGDEAFLAGHFPGAPMVPGVILIEAVAQLAGVAAQCDPALPPLDDMRLTAVRAAKITGSAVPGETLELGVQILGRLGSLIQAKGVVSVRGRQILQTQIVLSGEGGATAIEVGRDLLGS